MRERHFVLRKVKLPLMTFEKNHRRRLYRKKLQGGKGIGCGEGKGGNENMDGMGMREGTAQSFENRK